MAGAAWEWWYSLNEWFWEPRFWFPHNVTWDDLKNDPDSDIVYPESKDLLLPIPVAVVLIIIRILFEKYIASPIGRSYGLRDIRPKPPPENAILEKCYHRQSRPSHKVVAGLSKQTDFSEQRIQWWFRLRRNQDRPSVLRKFTESSWRFVYYLSIWVYGIAVLHDKPWFYDTGYCWYDYPFHSLEKEIKWYYMIEAGFYWSLTVSQFYDNKRKDFYQMFVHHVTTLLLMYFSYTCNMVRVGSLVLVIHDVVDWIMEAAKMAKYAKLQKLCDSLFAIFAIMWFITRLVIFPYRVIYPGMTEAHVLLDMPVMSCYYIYNSLLVALQVMHVLWFYMICRIAYIAIINGQVQKDDRSDTESEETPSNENGEALPDKVNGTAKK